MPIADLLQHRNFKVLSCNSEQGLIFNKTISPQIRTALFKQMHHYGFRTFLKDVILHKEQMRIKDLTRYCSEATAAKYLKKLMEWNIVKEDGKGLYRLKGADKIQSLGETLQWYVAQLFIQELNCDACWQVVLGDLPAGGDYDVLAQCEGRLVYLEVKSAPPKSVDLVNLRAFLRRVDAVRPNLVIFLEYTTLRMKDKIIPHLEDLLEGEWNHPIRFERLQNETFQWGSFFVTNAKPGILENIQHCLAAFLRDQGLKL